MADDKENIQAKGPVDLDDDDEEGMISLDDIDSIIAESDPEFEDQLQEIHDVKDDVFADADTAEEIIEEQEIILSFGERFPRINKLLVQPLKMAISHPIKFIIKIKELLAPLVLGFGKISVQMAQKVKSGSVNLVKVQLPKFAKKVSSVLKDISAFRKSQVVKFKALSLIKKAALLLFVVLFGLTLWAFKKSMMGVWIPFLQSGITYDLSKQAGGKFDIDENSRWMLVHEAFPQPEYSFLLDKFTVNLKRVGRGNPMVIIQLYITLDAQEAAIEVNDREKEILDLAQRITEDFTYAEINDPTGIYRFKTLVRNEMNSVLNTGRVKNVLIKYLVPKPP